MTYTGRTSITRSEYLQLLGLKILALKSEEKLKDVQQSIQAILQEPDVNTVGDGWAGELTYTERDVDEFIEIFSIEVSK